jgi:metal-responsive CopG/Arc/MetJ family transcriptional regulator
METQFTLRLPGPLHKRLARAANRLGLKRSDLARLAIQRYLDETEQMPRPRPYDAVRDLIGSLDSGVTDIGSRHREYLIARFRKRG